jgi:hypothetical protein
MILNLCFYGFKRYEKRQNERKEQERNHARNRSQVDRLRRVYTTLEKSSFFQKDIDIKTGLRKKLKTSSETTATECTSPPKA